MTLIRLHIWAVWSAPLLFTVSNSLPDKSADLKTSYIISQPKHMLWVLNETVLLSS